MSGISYEALSSILERPDAAESAWELGRYADRNVCCGHEYPVLHRVLDIVTSEGSYRVVRCTKCAEAIFILRIDREMATPALGVPLGLRGERLGDWVWEETNNPKKGSQDWGEWI